MNIQQLVALFVCTALIRIPVDAENPVGKVKTPIVEIVAFKRAVVMDCRSACTDEMKWQYKNSQQQDAQWMNNSNAEIYQNTKGFYILKGLAPDTTYNIQAINSTNNKIPGPVVRTCPVKPPKIKDVYVARSGVGWLDIRWTPLKESCESEMQYQVQYGAEEHEPTAEHSYGFWGHNKNRISEPYHPCPKWPREFCVLLTDNVKPGQKHIIQVRSQRNDPDSKELPHSDWTQVIALADAAYIHDAPCARSVSNRKSKSSKLGIENTPTGTNGPVDGFKVQLWIAGLAGGLVALAVIVILCAARRTWVSKPVSATSSPNNSVKRGRSFFSCRSNISYDYPVFRLGNFGMSRRIRQENSTRWRFDHNTVREIPLGKSAP